MYLEIRLVDLEDRRTGLTGHVDQRGDQGFGGKQRVNRSALQTASGGTKGETIAAGRMPTPAVHSCYSPNAERRNCMNGGEVVYLYR